MTEKKKAVAEFTFDDAGTENTEFTEPGRWVEFINPDTRETRRLFIPDVLEYSLFLLWKSIYAQ